MVLCVVSSTMSAIAADCRLKTLWGWFLRPKGVQNGIETGVKLLPRGLLELLGLLMTAWNDHGALFESSWRGLGWSWGPKKSLETPLGRPKASEETGFSIAWGRNALPKWVPEGSPNQGPKADQAQNCKTLIFNDPCKDSTVFFKARGLILDPQNGPKMGPESHLQRGSPPNASWSALGILLDALGAKKN